MRRLCPIPAWSWLGRFSMANDVGFLESPPELGVFGMPCRSSNGGRGCRRLTCASCWDIWLTISRSDASFCQCSWRPTVSSVTGLVCGGGIHGQSVRSFRWHEVWSCWLTRTWVGQSFHESFAVILQPEGLLFTRQIRQRQRFFLWCDGVSDGDSSTSRQLRQRQGDPTFWMSMPTSTLLQAASLSGPQSANILSRHSLPERMIRLALKGTSSSRKLSKLDLCPDSSLRCWIHKDGGELLLGGGELASNTTFTTKRRGAPCWVWRVRAATCVPIIRCCYPSATTSPRQLRLIEGGRDSGSYSVWFGGRQHCRSPRVFVGTVDMSRPIEIRLTMTLACVMWSSGRSRLSICLTDCLKEVHAVSCHRAWLPSLAVRPPRRCHSLCPGRGRVVIRRLLLGAAGDKSLDVGQLFTASGIFLDHGIQVVTERLVVLDNCLLVPRLHSPGVVPKLTTPHLGAPFWSFAPGVHDSLQPVSNKVYGWPFLLTLNVFNGTISAIPLSSMRCLSGSGKEGFGVCSLLHLARHGLS
jgi:hypothetical protein